MACGIVWRGSERCVVQVPKDRMLAALRRIWREMSSEEFRARVPGLLSDVTGIAMAMDRMLPYIYPMWEDGAESLGFSRSLEGVARFHRSATTFVRVCMSVWLHKLLLYAPAFSPSCVLCSGRPGDHRTVMAVYW